MTFLTLVIQLNNNYIFQTVKQFQVLLRIISKQLNGIKYNYLCFAHCKTVLRIAIQHR